MIFFISLVPRIPYSAAPEAPFSRPGQAGLEPATSGFGDRRSTIRATGLWMKALLYLRFLVQGVLPVPAAVLLQLELALHVLAVLGRRIVAPIALGALQRDQLEVFRLA